MPRNNPADFDQNKPLVMARFNTLGGHSMAKGDPITIAEDPTERGQVTVETATRLWAAGTFEYAADHRPTPVESPQDAARRLVEMEELPNAYFLIRAPWLEQGEKVHGRAAAEARRDELIEAGQPKEFTGTVVADSPLAGTGEGIQLPGAVDGSGQPLPPVQQQRTIEQRVQALVDANTERQLRDRIAELDAQRAAAEPPLEPLGAKSDHDKTELATLIVNADADQPAGDAPAPEA